VHDIGQLGEHGFVDRISAIRLVHPDDTDLVSAFHQQVSVGHLRLFRGRSVACADLGRTGSTSSVPARSVQPSTCLGEE
jgi:hypothetical protein